MTIQQRVEKIGEDWTIDPRLKWAIIRLCQSLVDEERMACAKVAVSGDLDATAHTVQHEIADKIRARVTQ